MFLHLVNSERTKCRCPGARHGAAPPPALVWLNGSFVTTKDELGDFDACWDTNGVDLDTLDPVLLDLSNHRAAQKARFGGELFPNVVEPASGLVFAEFFQNERDTGRKGIVVINLGGPL